MLTEEERRDIETEIEDCECPEAASVEALQALQRRRGWISDEAIRDAAPLLGMSPDELDGIATFYSFIFRRPVGRLGIGMGETTPDSRFTLLPVSCVGLCDHAPAMLIDEDLHGDLDSTKIDEILKKYP